MTIDIKRRDVALVIDDTAETLRMLTDALDGAGMTVMVALDGTSALRIVEQMVPDIILLDAVMPGLDGFETCRRLKRNAALNHVPVIFMTGLTETEDIVRGLEAGGVDYVTKPIAIEEMIARIRVHLTNARMAHRAQTALDVAGRFLFTVDQTGRLIWATPQADELLAQARDGDAGRIVLSESQQAWLLTTGAGDRASGSTIWSIGANQLRLHYMGKVGEQEYLLRLAPSSRTVSSDELRAELGLTGRESEVLSWISKGKTNRDIAQILGLSPRTIDKHLEQIYAKLGVENRTAAASIATAVQGKGR